MGGGLMQLVAYGAQDVYLTGNPQITFFKVVYRRHTNFSMEAVEQVYNGTGDFGRTVQATVNRNGDLITNMYALIQLNASSSSNANWGYVRRLGFALIQETKIEIGGSKIDEQYGDWLNIWYELSHKVGQERGFAKMIGDVPELTDLERNKSAYTMYVPLSYWFNRHTGLALPLIALQYHDVRVTIQFRKLNELINYQGNTAVAWTTQPAMQQSMLLIDYIYLDSEERKRFAQASHEYLIEQVQFTGSETLNNQSNKYRLNFNHPSKFLVWAPIWNDFQALSQGGSANQYVAYTANSVGTGGLVGTTWESARETFAKHVWLATRNGLAGSVSAGWTVDVSDNVVDGSANVPSKSGLTGALATLADGITAEFVFQDISSTSSGVALANPDNVVLLNYDVVDASAMTTTVTDLLSGNTSLSSVVAYLRSVGVTVSDYFNYGLNIDGTSNFVASAKLQLNGHDRFQERDGNYFNYVQPYQHFSNTPADGINVYSFALKPEEHQPSGTCNFSRIDNATLNVTTLSNVTSSNGGDQVNIYTVNYNVLRVMSGMAGTAYSN